MYIQITLAIVTAYFIIKLANLFLSSDKKKLLEKISKYKTFIFWSVGLLVIAAMIVLLDDSYGHRKSIKWASAIALGALIPIISAFVSAIRDKSKDEADEPENDINS